MQYWCKDRQADQWKRVDSVDIATQYGQLIFENNAKAFGGKRIDFSASGTEKIRYTYAKKNEP